MATHFFKAICFLFFITTSGDSEKELLHQGLELESAGHYEEALEVWASAFTKLDTPSLAIGREYIRLTTEQGLRDHYETASAIYLWGLTAESVEANRPALEKELFYLEPLAGRAMAREWTRLFEANNAELYRQIRLFWDRLNLAPGTDYNERLIEHWERIAHARQHFTINDNTVYQTDDRGVAYVLYGKPDRQFDGILRLSRGQIDSIIRNLDPLLSDGQRNVIRNTTWGLHEFQRYEIWIYDKPDPQMLYNLVLLFGDRPSGGYTRIRTVDDFIPHDAFSLSQRHIQTGASPHSVGEDPRLTPGMILQWLYYEQLATVDPYFAGVFTEMTHNWGGSPLREDNPGFGRSSGPILRNRTEANTLVNLNLAPPQLSTYDREFPDIPLRAYHYRMLDEANRPVAVTFLESQSRRVFVEDLAFNNETMFPDESVSAEEGFGWYDLTHGLQYLGRDGEEITHVRHPSTLILDFHEDLPSSSVFRVPYTEEGERLVLYAELHNRHPESRPELDTPFPQSLRGLGRIEASLPDPLSRDPAALEMADLILGYQMREEHQVGEWDEAVDASLFPFVVANDRRIPEGEELAVHLEIYNLELGEEGRTGFQITYEVVTERRMQWLRGPREELSLTLDMQTGERRFSESLEIRTRELEPGRYTLRLTAIDQVGGEQKKREIEFEVVEPETGNESTSGP